MWEDAYVLHLVLSFVQTKEESTSGSFKVSSVTREVVLGEKSETKSDFVLTLLHIVTNEEFLTTVMDF